VFHPAIPAKHTLHTLPCSVRDVRKNLPSECGRRAVPSGHAAVLFATATVIGRHHGVRWALPVYGLATYVPMSRLHDNVRSLSDALFGADVGTLAGRTVTRHGGSNFAVRLRFLAAREHFSIFRVQLNFTGPRVYVGSIKSIRPIGSIVRRIPTPWTDYRSNTEASLESNGRARRQRHNQDGTQK